MHGFRNSLLPNDSLPAHDLAPFAFILNSFLFLFDLWEFFEPILSMELDGLDFKLSKLLTPEDEAMTLKQVVKYIYFYLSFI